MKQSVLIATFSFFIVLAFQACSNKVILNSPSESQAPKSNLNGEGYSGKPTPFDFSDPAQPCVDIGANGKPLPNSQIFVFASGTAQLVRQNCTDISPKPLNPGDYTITANGDIIYQGQTFTSNLNQSPFDVVAASCPAGKTMLASPVRSSLVADPLDLQSSAWDDQGLSVSLEGSLASLPVYRLERTDPSTIERWHRVAQSPVLAAGESYALSFFVKPSSSEKVSFIAYATDVQDFEVEINLATGASTVTLTKGVTFLSAKSQNFAGGIYVNIYFQSLLDVKSNLGISSSGEFLGSSISATAIQLEKLSNFCTP